MMPAVRKSARVCETCGSPIQTTGSGDFGCMVCLLDAALNPDAEGSEVAFASVLDQFGAYTIEHHVDGSAWELGRGAMGVTYRASDKVLDRPVALKIINTNLGSRSAEARERFMREARAAAALRHPNVATVYQFGVREETGQFFYAMELVEGETLEERVRRMGPLDVGTTIEIAQQVTAALAAAEKRGLIHRDLKPANLMLVSAGQIEDVGTLQHAVPTVKVIDFGVAKAVAEKTNRMALTHGGFVGTPGFASPEQFTNAPVDVRSDIYSLGATLWFALTGKTPFGGHSVEEIHRAQQSNALPIEQLKAAHVPSRLRSLLESMLALEPAARPGVHNLAARLRRYSAQASGVPRARVALTAILIPILGMSAFFVFRSLRTQNLASNPAAPEKSIAVLPFENLSNDRQDAFFAEGVQDEILTDLARIAGLKVTGRTSVMQYRSGVARDLRKIGQELGVAHVVEGTVQRGGGRVRVSAQLSNVADGFHLWAATYDREMTDILEIRSDISRHVVDALKIQLGVEETQRLAKKPTEDVKAYEAYLLGRFELNKFTEKGFANSVQYFQQAIALDPEFALAHASLAEAYNLIGYWGFLPPKEAFPEAKEAALKALDIDPGLAEVHTALAYNLFQYEWKFEEAEMEFKEAIRLNPNSVSARLRFAEYLSDFQRVQEAHKQLERASALDPLSVEISYFFAGESFFARDFDRAIEQLQKTTSIDPNNALAYFLLAAVFYQKRMPVEAFTANQTGDSLEGIFSNAEMLEMRKAYETSGLSAYFRKENKLRQKRLAEGKYQSPLTIALNYARAGANSEALDWLERAVDERTPWLPELKMDPTWDAVRSQSRFVALLKKIGLQK